MSDGPTGLVQFTITRSTKKSELKASVLNNVGDQRQLGCGLQSFHKPESPKGTAGHGGSETAAATTARGEVLLRTLCLDHMREYVYMLILTEASKQTTATRKMSQFAFLSAILCHTNIRLTSNERCHARSVSHFYTPSCCYVHCIEMKNTVLPAVRCRKNENDT